MSNKITIRNNNKINELIDNFVKKILLIEKESSTLENKVIQIDKLLDNLIDYCIKKKIYYYIEKNIGYSKIIETFKLHLCKFLEKLIDPTGNVIKKYIQKIESENLENYSDINSLLFRKFKSESEIKSSSKSKSKSELKSKTNSSSNKNVSFREDISIIGYDDSEGFDFNYANINKSRKKLESGSSTESSSKSSSKSFSDESEESTESENSSDSLDTDRLALYIKILLSQNKYVNEFIEKLRYMCVVITEKGFGPSGSLFEFD